MGAVAAVGALALAVGAHQLRLRRRVKRLEAFRDTFREEYSLPLQRSGRSEAEETVQVEERRR